MTYTEVAELFAKFEKASTWPSKNPERFYFWVRGREGHGVAFLREDDEKARYLWLPIEEVGDYIEPTGTSDSENVYYRLKK